ncbi:unnamed protein product, partial [Nesidiocoris tenuis]
ASRQDVEGFKPRHELHDKTRRDQKGSWRASRPDVEGFKTRRELHDRTWRASKGELEGFNRYRMWRAL